jgi:hypothetical protein
MKPHATLIAGFLVLSALSSTAVMFPCGNGESLWLSSSDSEFNGTGRFFNDTMLEGTGGDARVTLLRAGDWFDMKPVSSPESGYNYVVSAIGGNDKALLFGGYSSYSPLNETWIYDAGNDTWTQMMPALSPPARYSHAMATIWNDDRVILFGGVDSGGGYPEDTWIYDLSDNQWTQLGASTHPSGRIGHGMASVPGVSKVVLFGANDQNDTWLFDSSVYRWVQVFPTGYLPPAGGGDTASIWNDDKVVLYRGGSTLSTWVYDIGTNEWSRKYPMSPPTDIGWPALATIPNDDKVILYDGHNGQTWIYDLSEDLWRQRMTLGHPPASYGSGLATLQPSRIIILYGSEQTYTYDLSAYIEKGSYTSAFHDTGDQSRLINITWDADVPPNCTLRFQVRSASSRNTIQSTDFTGPDGTPQSYYEEEYHLMPNLPVNRWVQYKALLSTTDPNATPSIRGVLLAYNRIPQPTLLTSPGNQTWTNLTYPVFDWTFTDYDSTQGGFEWQMGMSSDIFPSVFTSGQEDTNETSFSAMDPMPEGSWYWRVRTRDVEGDWGRFSESWLLGVDLTRPADFKPQASSDEWSASPVTISFSTTDSLSGVAGYRVYIDAADQGLRESPFSLPELPDGIHRIVVRAYDRAGNYAEGWNRILVDRTPPEPFVPEISPPNWTTLSPEITFSATDNASGVDHYEVRINEGGFTRQASPFVPWVLPSGESTVTVRAFDRAGNFRDGTALLYIDTLPPSEVTATMIPASWTNQDPWLKVHVLDPDSGLGRVEVSVGNNVYSSDGDTVKVPGLDEGINTVRFRVFDRVGNVAEGSAIAHIDRTPPIAFQPGASPSGWQKECPRILYSTRDNLSGMDRYELSVDGGQFSQRAPSSTIMLLPDGVRNITVRAFDKAGNHMDGNLTVFIDSRPPVNVSLHINEGAGSTKLQAVRLTIAASDDNSGPYEMRLSNDGVSYGHWEPFRTSRDWTLGPGKGEKEVFLRVRDRAGNEAAVVFASIDYEPDPWADPVIPISVSALLIIVILVTTVFLKFRAQKRKTG